MTPAKPRWSNLSAVTCRSSAASAWSPPPPTGARVADAYSDLEVARLKSGPFGGDQQIGAMIAEQKLDVLIFFVDPLTSMPHDVDVKALIRLAAVYDLPLACSRATAELLLRGLAANAPEETDA